MDNVALRTSTIDSSGQKQPTQQSGLHPTGNVGVKAQQITQLSQQARTTARLSNQLNVRNLPKAIVLTTSSSKGTAPLRASVKAVARVLPSGKVIPIASPKQAISSQSTSRARATTFKAPQKTRSGGRQAIDASSKRSRFSATSDQSSTKASLDNSSSPSYATPSTSTTSTSSSSSSSSSATPSISTTSTSSSSSSSLTATPSAVTSSSSATSSAQAEIAKFRKLASEFFKAFNTVTNVRETITNGPVVNKEILDDLKKYRMGISTKLQIHLFHFYRSHTSLLIEIGKETFQAAKKIRRGEISLDNETRMQQFIENIHDLYTIRDIEYQAVDRIQNSHDELSESYYYYTSIRKLERKKDALEKYLRELTPSIKRGPVSDYYSEYRTIIDPSSSTSS